MLTDKIRTKQSGILLYGITPPKVKHTSEEIEVIAKKHVDRISKLDIDGLVLYDIQDESDRTDEKRPFPFIKTLNPCEYSKKYLQDLKTPRIVYRAVGNFTSEKFTAWLEETKQSQVHSVFVGAASHEQQNNITLREAYSLKREVNDNLCLGGITIPERHTKKHNEHERVFAKIDSSCEYFITQCVYDLEAAKIFLSDYAKYSKENNKEMVPIIFTLTPCGSAKTLDFMKWLGINIPNYLEEDLKDSGNILEESVRLSKMFFEELYIFGKKRGIPVGCNVESVAIRKEEIDASVDLLNEVKKIIKDNE
ncbi:methylenetetrahydrofolate reductase [Poseidonibacter lekithochrous]|uniref:methylenetetrahydrofolate reductase n=1 Tax=Poseidonibacter lekithochrous TaxID=1904463 RepID=UPI0008FC9035|nr:methylenetetrahydrofolate reductase [Poseidonibacter lekithochrous]QKJ22838.1 methylenetetrahydrofolate reductase family protein [Poseidonibacter lekithochrous]